MRNDDEVTADVMRALGASEATKHDTGKPRLELPPPLPQIEVAQVFGHGAAKYGEGNYLLDGGLDPMRLYGAVQRHLLAWRSGEIHDPESGLPHLAHAVAGIYMIREIEDL